MKDLNFAIEEETSYSSHIESSITRMSDQGKIVLILGNLKCFPTTEYFDKLDWKHLFLVNGYDADNKICCVLDSNHQDGKNGLIYKPFHIPLQYME